MLSGQQNPLPFTPIEESDISKSTNRFTSNTTYNEAGQVVNDTKFRSMSFGYDANGRTVKAAKANTPDAWTVYDALGNRVATKVNDVWQFMIYDAFGKLVAEYGSEPGATATGSVVNSVKYIHQDWQGSVRTVTNNAGFVLSRTDHQAFGEEISAGIGLRTAQQGFNGGNSATRQGYGLTEKDASSGLNHTWFRKQESSAGRWTSPDPYKGSMSLGNPQSFNRYSYVNNQPTNFIDPSGLLMWACEDRFQVAVTCVDGDCGVDWGNSRWVTICTLVSGGGYYPMPSGSGGGGGGGGGIDIGGSGSPDGCDNEDTKSPRPPKPNLKDCLRNEAAKCAEREESYFNANAPWEVVKAVLSVPSIVVGGGSIFVQLRNIPWKRLLRLALSRASIYTAIVVGVWELYDVTQNAIAIGNECKRHILDKCR